MYIVLMPMYQYIDISQYSTYQYDLNVYRYMPKCIGIWRYIDQYIVASLVYVELYIDFP